MANVYQTAHTHFYRRKEEGEEGVIRIANVAKEKERKEKRRKRKKERKKGNENEREEAKYGERRSFKETKWPFVRGRRRRKERKNRRKKKGTGRKSRGYATLRVIIVAARSEHES